MDFGFKLLLHKFPQYATDFVFKKVFLVTSPESAEQSQWQTAGTSEEEA